MAYQRERIGQRFGEYRLECLLGRGTFGVVYLAEHIHDRTQAAVKLLHLQITSREDLKDFLNEARTMRLRHPHIVPLLDFGLSSDDVPYLVMEYASHGTLRQRYPKGTKLPLNELATYVSQLASALQYAHTRRVIHRDVKPENMLLRADGTVLLSDFGIAKVLEQSTASSLQTHVGTPAYMAPEQSQGKACPASDQYALAVIVYEWLTGQRPFQGTSIEVALQHRLDAPPPLGLLRPDLPLGVEPVIFKALAKQPEERFATVEHFAQALQVALQRDEDDATQPAKQTVPPVQAPSLPGRSTLFLSEPASPREASAEIALNTPSPLTRPQVATAPLPSPAVLAPITPRVAARGRLRASEGRRGIFSKRVLLPVLLVLLVILAGAGGIWLTHAQQSPQHPRSVAGTEQVPQFATATTQGDPRATATAAVNAYKAAVSASDIQFGFDAQHTHYNPYERILSPSNVAGLKRAWTGQAGDRVDSSPAVVNGVVYVASYQDQTFYAFRADGCGKASCAPLWTARADSTLYSSPAVAHGVVYFGDGDGTLYAFNANGCGRPRCTPLWIAQTGGYMDSSPTVVNGVVYVGSGDHRLYAFKAGGCGQASCSPLWSAETGDAIASSPAVANGVVYVGSGDHKLYAFNANGCGLAYCAPLWTASTGNSIFSSPAVANGVVYVGSGDGKLYAFKAGGCGQANCPPLWTAQTGDHVSSSPAVANGVVYAGSHDGKLYAFKADGCGQASCAPLWTFWTSQTLGGIHSSPTIANGVLYIGGSDSKVYALKADGCGQAFCTPLWSAQTGNSINSVPAIANGMMYIGSGDHKLYAFQL